MSFWTLHQTQNHEQTQRTSLLFGENGEAALSENSREVADPSRMSGKLSRKISSFPDRDTARSSEELGNMGASMPLHENSPLLCCVANTLHI